MKATSFSVSLFLLTTTLANPILLERDSQSSIPAQSLSASPVPLSTLLAERAPAPEPAKPKPKTTSAPAPVSPNPKPKTTPISSSEKPVGTPKAASPASVAPKPVEDSSAASKPSGGLSPNPPSSAAAKVSKRAPEPDPKPVPTKKPVPHRSPVGGQDSHVGALKTASPKVTARNALLDPRAEPQPAESKKPLAGTVGGPDTPVTMVKRASNAPNITARNALPDPEAEPKPFFGDYAEEVYPSKPKHKLARSSVPSIAPPLGSPTGASDPGTLPLSTEPLVPLPSATGATTAVGKREAQAESTVVGEPYPTQVSEVAPSAT